MSSKKIFFCSRYAGNNFCKQPDFLNNCLHPATCGSGIRGVFIIEVCMKINFHCAENLSVLGETQQLKKTGKMDVFSSRAPQTAKFLSRSVREPLYYP